MPLRVKYQLIERPAWPPPMTATAWRATGVAWLMETAPCLFLERVDGDACVVTIRERFCRGLDAFELGHRAGAIIAILRLHAIAGDGECGTTAVEEISKRISLARHEVVFHHQRGR